jgi:hypothetical protein
MSQFRNIDLNFATAEKELKTFRQFVASNKNFSETKIVTELKKRPHLSCLVLAMNGGVRRATKYKFEFQIQGVFRADLVVGNIQQKRFVLVEFESGEPTSLFGPGKTNQMRHWSQRLEHGFGQLVDWAWAIKDAGGTLILKNSFGCDEMSALYLLVCGRDHDMDNIEMKRFNWRSQKVTAVRFVEGHFAS